MGEVVPVDRSGGWRKRQRQAEEIAVGIAGPLPRRQGPAHPLADWLKGNQNGLKLTLNTRFEKDLFTITTLKRSGRVDPLELLAYLTPDLLLGQDDKIDPVNVRITEIINDMAFGRRALLLMMLKKKVIASESIKITNDLSRFPVEVLQLQGEIAALNGRYVRIPLILVSKVALLS